MRASFKWIQCARLMIWIFLQTTPEEIWETTPLTCDTFSFCYCVTDAYNNQNVVKMFAIRWKLFLPTQPWLPHRWAPLYTGPSWLIITQSTSFYSQQLQVIMANPFVHKNDLSCSYRIGKDAIVLLLAQLLCARDKGFFPCDQTQVGLLNVCPDLSSGKKFSDNRKRATLRVTRVEGLCWRKAPAFNKEFQNAAIFWERLKLNDVKWRGRIKVC